MTRYGRKVKTGIFIGCFFSILIFCIIVWKIVFGYNVTNKDDLSIYKSFLCIRDPENSVWIDFYKKDEVFGKCTLVLKRNIRIEEMSNDEKINYYQRKVDKVLTAQNSNIVSYKDGINDCIIRNDDKSLEVTVVRR